MLWQKTSWLSKLSPRKTSWDQFYVCVYMLDKTSSSAVFFFFSFTFVFPVIIYKKGLLANKNHVVMQREKKSILSFVESSARTMKPVPSPPWAGFMVQVRNRQTKVCGRVVFLKQQLRRYRLSKKSWKTVYFFRKSRLILWTFDSWISSGEPSYSLLSVISCRKRHPVKQMLFLVL